jgi:repressor LexA
MQIIGTETSRRALGFIARSHLLHGFPPSIREIGAAIGASSSSTANAVVKDMLDRQWITMKPRTARTIVITEKGLAALAGDPETTHASR